MRPPLSKTHWKKIKENLKIIDTENRSVLLSHRGKNALCQCKYLHKYITICLNSATALTVFRNLLHGFFLKPVVNAQPQSFHPDTSLTGLAAPPAAGAAAGWGSAPGPFGGCLAAQQLVRLLHRGYASHTHTRTGAYTSFTQIFTTKGTNGSKNEPRTLLPWQCLYMSQPGSNKDAKKSFYRMFEQLLDASADDHLQILLDHIAEFKQPILLFVFCLIEARGWFPFDLEPSADPSGLCSTLAEH